MEDYYMTISKKLLIIATLALGLNTIGLAYYDAATLKTEVVQIINFAQDLQKQTSPEAKKVAKYLNKALADTNYVITSKDIIVLANIINSDATTDAKIASILNIKTENVDQQAKHDKKQHKFALKGRTIDAVFITGLCIFMGFVLYQDMHRTLVRKIENHDDNLLSQVQTMINNKFADINQNNKKKWFFN